MVLPHNHRRFFIECEEPDKTRAKVIVAGFSLQNEKELAKLGLDLVVAFLSNSETQQFLTSKHQIQPPAKG